MIAVGRRRAMLGAVALVLVGAAFVAGRLSRGFDPGADRAPMWTVGGYQLDNDWGEVARSLSCSDSERPWTGHARWCFAGDGLDLYFAEDDALAEMVYEVPIQESRAELDPRQLWLELRDEVRSIVGEPDTVGDVTSDVVGRRLNVFWRGSGDQCAKLEVLGRPYVLGDRARAVLTISKCTPS